MYLSKSWSQYCCCFLLSFLYIGVHKWHYILYASFGIFNLKLLIFTKFGKLFNLLNFVNFSFWRKRRPKYLFNVIFLQIWKATIFVFYVIFLFVFLLIEFYWLIFIKTHWIWHLTNITIFCSLFRFLLPCFLHILLYLDLHFYLLT